MEPNLFEQLAHMLEAKLPLPASLRQLASASRTASRREQLEQMAAGIESGRPVEEALEEALPGMDPAVWHMISASQASGNLPQVLFELARQGTEERRFIGRLREMLAYPLFNILFACGILIFLFMQMGQAAVTALSENGMYAGPDWLSGFLQALKAAQPICIVIWVIAFMLFLILILGGRFSAPWILAIAQRVPGMRRVVRYLQTARVAKMLSSTVRSRLPLNQALTAIGQTLPARRLRNDLMQAAADGETGAAPAEMLRQDSIDPLLPLVFEHTETETLPDELARVATVLEDRAAFRQERFIRRWTLTLYISMCLVGLVIMIVMLLPYMMTIRSLTS